MPKHIFLDQNINDLFKLNENSPLSDMWTTCRMDSMIAAVLLSGGSLPLPAFTMYSPYNTSYDACGKLILYRHHRLKRLIKLKIIEDDSLCKLGMCRFPPVTPEWLKIIARADIAQCLGICTRVDIAQCLGIGTTSYYLPCVWDSVLCST